MMIKAPGYFMLSRIDSGVLRVLLFSTFAIPAQDAHLTLCPKISLHKALQHVQWTEMGHCCSSAPAQHAQGAKATAGHEAAGDGLEDAIVAEIHKPTLNEETSTPLLCALGRANDAQPSPWLPPGAEPGWHCTQQLQGRCKMGNSS